MRLSISNGLARTSRIVGVTPRAKRSRKSEETANPVSLGMCYRESGEEKRGMRSETVSLGGVLVSYAIKAAMVAWMLRHSWAKSMPRTRIENPSRRTSIASGASTTG